MTWQLAFSPPGRLFYMLLSEHITAQHAFEAMIADSTDSGRPVRQYTVRGLGFDLRKWSTVDAMKHARQLVPYGFDDRNDWFAARYGSTSLHGKSTPVAYMTQATTLDRLLRTIAGDPAAGGDRNRPSVTHIPSSLRGIIYTARRTMRIV